MRWTYYTHVHDRKQLPGIFCVSRQNYRESFCALHNRLWFPHWAGQQAMQDVIGGILGLGGFLLGWLAVFGLPGQYIANICGQPRDRGFWHGVLLGPLGWLLIALYPRPSDAQWQEATELLTAIRNELTWQRQQKEKELHRAKAAAAKHAPTDGA